MGQLEFYPKEISILQQSQSKLALDFLKSNNITPTAEELWRVTEIFVQCCLHKPDDSLNKRIKALDTWIKSKQTNVLKDQLVTKLTK
jgi:hypothetical protein